MALREGIRPPASDRGMSLPVSWGNGPVVAVAVGVAGAPFVTGPLARGVYVIQTTEPLWWNIGPNAGDHLDHTLTTDSASAAALKLAPKIHWGGDLAVAVDDDERIAAKAIDGAANVRIFKGA